MYAKGAQTDAALYGRISSVYCTDDDVFHWLFIYNETFGKIDLVSFAFIWSALLLFTMTKLYEVVKLKEANLNESASFFMDYIYE